MAYSQSRINDMYERVLACLDAEFAELPKNSGGGIAAQGLRDAFAEIRSKDSAKSGFSDSAQTGTGARSTARFNVKDYRATLARTANVVAHKKPGFNRDFPPPSSETDDELIANTRAVAAKAVEKQADFDLRGLSLEYLESGVGLVDAFEAAFDPTNTALSHRGAAVGGKNTAYREAEEHFDELDIFIRNFYRDRPEKLAAWKIASHVERAPQKAKPPNKEDKA